MTTSFSVLGAFIRTHREKITPAEAGLAVHGRRRTHGLRREELAQLCGLSTTWLTWIEQGRPVKPSAAVLDRLSHVLQLSAAERAYLFHLAERSDPETKSSHALPSHAVARIVQTLTTPAYILDRYWRAVVWNKEAAELFVGWLDGGDDQGLSAPSLLDYLFLSASARELIFEWDRRARRLVAEFRADAATRFSDPVLERMVADLRAASPDFKTFWASQDVVEREGGSRSFQHPTRGPITFEQTTLIPAMNTDLKLVILLAT